MDAHDLVRPPTREAGPGDEWRTPPFVFEFMNRLHRFGIDLAATEHNALCSHWFDIAGDGLKEDWAWYAGAFHVNPVGWLNPPYSNIDPWLAKARNEAVRGFTTVALIPAPNGERIYHRHVFGIASEVMFIEGRLAFLMPDGKPKPGNTRGSIIVTYRAHDLGNTRFSFIGRDEMAARVASWRSGQVGEAAELAAGGGLA